MPHPIRFHPAALRDANEAAGWYAERSARAAIRFLDELDRLIESIAAAPDRFPLFEGVLRRAIFRRFPYYIVFRPDVAGITVLAIAHAKRRPNFWHGRS